MRLANQDISLRMFFLFWGFETRIIYTGGQLLYETAYCTWILSRFLVSPVEVPSASIAEVEPNGQTKGLASQAGVCRCGVRWYNWLDLPCRLYRFFEDVISYCSYTYICTSIRIYIHASNSSNEIMGELATGFTCANACMHLGLTLVRKNFSTSSAISLRQHP